MYYRALYTAALVVCCLAGTTACGANSYGRKDVDRYVIGDNPKATILSSPTEDTTNNYTDTYVLCLEDGTIGASTIVRSEWSKEPTSQSTKKLDSLTAACGKRLEHLMSIEQEVNRIVHDAYTAPAEQIKAIKEALK